MSNNWLVKELGLQLPVIQAPLAGITKSRMVAAASSAGILGSLGAGMLTTDDIKKEVNEIRSVTNKPFNINLFVIDNYENGYDIPANDIKWLKDYYSKEGLEFSIPKSFANKFEDQFKTVLELSPAVASFAFGIITAEQVKACHDRNIKVIGTATNAEEAIAWERVGADAICAQGIEAGGHRGSFINLEDPGIGLFALIPEIKSSVSVPVIAAGGIMDGRGVVAALTLGADVVQLGTYFLGATETAISEPYLNAIIGKKSGSTTSLTKGFTGRYARGVTNRFMIESKDKTILPYPIQNALTMPLRKGTVAKGDSESTNLWTGQGLYQLKKGLTIKELVDILEKEIADIKN